MIRRVWGVDDFERKPNTSRTFYFALARARALLNPTTRTDRTVRMT